MNLTKQTDKMRVKAGKKLKLNSLPTTPDHKKISKDEAAALLQKTSLNMQEMQEKLYGENSRSLLIVIQAMDAAGKDSLVKHVMNGLNPTGVKVYPFGVPTKTELEHDYLWRHNLALPGRGEIGIFVRSHYENVIVARVHPEIVLNERIPGMDDVKKIDNKFFKTRFRQLNDWEKHLTENGTTIIKFFLHTSKEEQKKQLLERIDDATKHWKFNYNDIVERRYWDKYMECYEDAIANTHTEHAPWYIIPADSRAYARIAVAHIIATHMSALGISYPAVPPELKEKLAAARKELMEEK